MSHKILTFSILFLNYFGYSQSIKGEIIDVESKESIPYVNVGILHKKIGTVSGVSSESSQLWLSGGFLNSDSYVRFTSQSDWEKVAMGLGIWATVKYKK